jgi:hypothetical protein
MDGNLPKLVGRKDKDATRKITWSYAFMARRVERRQDATTIKIYIFMNDKTIEIWIVRNKIKISSRKRNRNRNSPVRWYKNFLSATTGCYHLISILTIHSFLLINFRVDGDNLLGADQDGFLVLGLVGAANDQDSHDSKHAKEYADSTAYHRKSAISANNRINSRQNRNRT